MVDRTFLEWDKRGMSTHLQQLDSGLQASARKAGVAVNWTQLSANRGLLVLVIIPTTIGVALIA